MPGSLLKDEILKQAKVAIGCPHLIPGQVERSPKVRIVMRTKVELPLGWNQGRRYKATVSMVSPAEMLSQGKLLLPRYRLLRICVRALK